MGPVLTHIGKTQDRAKLLESIILPSKVIAPGFEIVVLSLKDGNMVVGKLVGQDAAGLKIETMDAQGKPQMRKLQPINNEQRIALVEYLKTL